MQLNKIDFIIKTFERYDCLGELLESIEKFYPGATLFIADDSSEINKDFYAEWNKKLKITLIELPFNGGLSFGRNMILEYTSAPYILLLDDDFIFTEETKIERFLDVLENSNAMICGGCTIHNGNEERYEFNIEYSNGVLTKKKISQEGIKVGGQTVYKTDSVLNFFLADAELFKYVRWDNSLKLSEHLSFFLDFKLAGFLCYYLPDVKIIHTKKRNANYNYFRKKGKEYQIEAFTKARVKKIIDETIGQVHELKDNNINISML